MFVCPGGGGGQVGFPVCITGHMTRDMPPRGRGSASNGGLPPGGSASGGSGSRWCLRPGCLHRGRGLHLVGSVSRGACIGGRDLPPGDLHQGEVCIQGELGWTDPLPQDAWDTTGYGQQAGSTHLHPMLCCWIVPLLIVPTVAIDFIEFQMILIESEAHD